MGQKPLVMAMVAATTIATTAAAETELTFNILFPPTHFSWPVFEAWAADIATATDGEVVLTFPPQSVAPPPGILDAVRNGVADGGFIFNGFLAQSAPGTVVTMMPFVHVGDTEALSVAFWETYQKEFADVEDLRGVELVSGFHLSENILCSTSDKPITSLDDLRNRRLWTLPGTITDTMAAMGLSITAGPAVQLQELTSRNTVDAHFGLTWETIPSFGVAPYTKSCVETLPALHSASFTVFFNQRTWDRLSEEHRAAILELSGSALAARIGAATDIADEAARAQLLEDGVEVTPLDESLLSAMQEAANSVAQSWSEKVGAAYGVDGMAILEGIRASVAEQSN